MAAALFISIFLSASGCSNNTENSGVKFFTPAEDGLVMDEFTGLMTMKDVISITFSSKTDDETMKNILSSINGEVVGYDKSVKYYQIRFPGSDLQTIENLRLEILGKYKEVELASTIPVSAHKNPYYAK